MRLGLLQYQVGRYASFAAWRTALEQRIAEAAQAGAELLLLPEYAGLDVILTPQPDLTAELAAACDQHDAVIEAMREAAARFRVWLLGGSMPMRRHDRVINHAPLIAPSGRVWFQDKHRPTRFEAEFWGVSGGRTPGVFETPWGRIGACICYDVEFPPLARAQVAAGAWLLLVPACTDTVAGFNRVCLAARARALENQCFVAIAPTVGDAPWLAALDANHGFAAVFGPVDCGFPDDGIIVQGAMDAPGWIYADLDPARIVAVRSDGAVLNYRDYPETPETCSAITAWR